MMEFKESYRQQQDNEFEAIQVGKKSFIQKCVGLLLIF